jgi:UDP-N-acetylglucosamine 2-epimerase (non-hydrolysing)
MQTIAHIIEKTDEVLAKEQPYALFLYGDTNSCLSIISESARRTEP